jgi:hypothetical protein
MRVLTFQIAAMLSLLSASSDVSGRPADRSVSDSLAGELMRRQTSADAAAHLTADDTIQDLLNHPAFAGCDCFATGAVGTAAVVEAWAILPRSDPFSIGRVPRRQTCSRSPPSLSLSRLENASPPPQDVVAEEAIRTIVAGQVIAWNAGDAKGYASDVASDVSFTNLFGMVMYGREAFERRHAGILATFYKGTTK